MGVAFRPGLPQVSGLNIGLRPIRRRQRSLTKGVLALFCAAWLQAAILPCTMAHTSDAAPATTAAGAAQQHDGHDGHAGHEGHGAPAVSDHAGSAADSGTIEPAHPCPYCPPGDSLAADCDGHGCAFPHDPQVDGRSVGAIFAAMPVSFAAAAPGARVVALHAGAVTPEIVPRVSLSVSYCRFIE
jgi:hypothetical protein